MLLEEAERLEESNEEDLAEEDLILTYNKRYLNDKSVISHTLARFSSLSFVVEQAMITGYWLCILKKDLNYYNYFLRNPVSL